MRWMFWEMDLHQKRTYQCYLPETTPVMNTFVEVMLLIFGLFFAYLYMRFRVFYPYVGPPIDFNVPFSVGLLIISLLVSGTKNFIKWQKLERRLFEEHQNSVANSVELNAN